MRIILAGAVVLAGIAAIFVFGATNPMIDRLEMAALDGLDHRPPHAVLLSGNSRTYYNDMPYMVRKMADSAHDPQKYLITADVQGGGNVEQAWNDAGVRQHLRLRWQDVVIQPESAAQSSGDGEANFFRLGKSLVTAARAAGSPSAMIVNWAYGQELFTGQFANFRPTQYQTIQSDYRRLADQTGASLINTGEAWELLSAERPSFPLYLDGNHPTLYGSYLSAIMLYDYLSKSDGSAVTYVPSSMSAADAAMIRRIAAAETAMQRGTAGAL